MPRILLGYSGHFDTEHCTLNCTLYTVLRAVYIVECTVYSPHCTVYTVHYTVFGVHFKGDHRLLLHLSQSTRGRPTGWPLPR